MGEGMALKEMKAPASRVGIVRLSENKMLIV